MILCTIGLALVPQAGGGWLEYSPIPTPSQVRALDSLADWDGDGAGEVLVGMEDESVRILSGRTGAELLRVNAFAADSDFGSAVAALGDVDGDGIDDFAVAAPREAFGVNISAGVIRFCSGASGAVLFAVGGLTPGDQWGTALARAGDLNLDGVADLLIGANQAFPNRHGLTGALFAVSGSTGAILHQVSAPFDSDQFGDVISSLGDLDGDTIADYALGTPDLTVLGQSATGGVSVHSGADGSPFFSILGRTYYGHFGRAVATAGDVNGDRVPDLMASASYATVLGGEAWIFSGADGSRLRTLRGLQSRTAIGTQLLGGVDLNGDGKPDFVVGSAGHDVPGVRHAGAVYVFSGEDGSVLHLLEGDDFEQLGYYLAYVSGLGGAMFPDVAVGGYSPVRLRTLGYSHLLRVTPEQVSAAAGGVVSFQLDFLSSESGRPYLLLASATGTGPSNFGGIQVPLTADAAYVRMLTNPPAAFANARGVLGPNARALATLTLSPGVSAAWIGRTFWFAAATYDGVLARISSSAATLAILP